MRLHLEEIAHSTGLAQRAPLNLIQVLNSLRINEIDHLSASILVQLDINSIFVFLQHGSKKVLATMLNTYRYSGKEL